MAIPLVFRILPLGLGLTDPIEGPTAGKNLVEIYGDGFRLPLPADPNDAPDPTAPTQRTVEVLFGTQVAARVDVIRTNKIRVLAPSSALQVVTGAAISSPEGAVDITIRNLDDSEVPIPGEEIIVPDAYTYRRPALDATASACVRYIVQQFVLAWKRDTIGNVLISEHTEWDADTADALNILSLAELPAIVLVGPDVPENTFYSIREFSEDTIIGEDGSPTVVLRPPPKTVDLVFDVVLISKHEGELLALLQLARSFIRATPFFELDRDPLDSSAGTVRYEMDEAPGGTFTKQSRPNNSDMKSYTGTVVIRGVDIEGAPGFGALRDRATDAMPVLTVLPTDGSLDVEPV